MNNKFIAKKFLLLISFASICSISFCQTNTYILVRHAEKDTTQAGSTMMNANPNLNKLGLKRSKKLIKALKEFTIDSIYSTNFTRTIQTATPTSKKRKVEIKLYNHKQLKEFSAQLKSYTNKTILVVGHSNSTTALVNLLINKETYKALDESIYYKIFIVKLTNGEATVEEREY